MPKEFQYDVFLSHNAHDKPRVREIAERLKQAGLRVWFDEWNIGPGDIIALKVDEGLEESRVLVLCVSPEALASGWVALERSTAIHRDPTNGGRGFIPLLLDECNLPASLSRYKYLDFRDSSDDSFAKLLVACRSGNLDADRLEPLSNKVHPERNSAEATPATLSRILYGHKGGINDLLVSPDGNWLASASSDKTVRIWNLNTGEVLATLRHDDGVKSLGVTPDGNFLLSSSIQEKIIRVWDASSWKQVACWEVHNWGALTLVPLHDNRTIFSAGASVNDPFLRLFDLGTGECQQVFSGHNSVVHSAAILADNVRGISASSDTTLKVWNLETGEVLRTLKGHSGPVLTVKCTQDGRFAVSGSTDSTIKVWDLDSGACVGTLEGHRGHVSSVAIMSDGKTVASAGSSDGTFRLWDWKVGVCLQTINLEKHDLATSIALNPAFGSLVTGSNDGLICIYNISETSETAIEGIRRYVNAKVVLLGEGAVGKTSLAHRLVEDKYVIRDRTHGMKVWRLDLPVVSDVTMECEALLWDLAGQEDYRLIHPLFLQETALALLLVNPQTANPFREAGDWLKMLKSVVKGQERRVEVSRLLVLSQIDVGGPKVSNGKLDHFCEENGFQGWLATSAKTGERCSDGERGGPSDLKQLIADSIPWDKLPWTVTDPPLLAELKNAVMAMRSKTDIRLLRFAELSQRLEQAFPGEKIGESEVRTAVQLLANQGLARTLKFGDLVLLQPELLNGYAAAIIRAARAHTDEIGCVLEDDIYKENFDFTGVERLKHRPDEELLLRALVQTFLDHSLCIAENTPKGRHLVFPSQYRREKDLPRDPDIFVSYTFCGEWQTVWTTLIVRLWYSHEFEHRELWRNAAEFASPKGYTLGVKIDNKQGEGTATISFYFDKDVPEELKSIFIEYGHRHLARYATEVSRDRRYVCPECGKPVNDLAAVRKRLDAKKDFITCQECDERVPLIDFIEQRLKSDPVARKILEMDEVATRALDTQALEQILIGHMMAIAGEANQIFRPAPMFDYGIDGEVEFKDDDGKASGKRIYIQLKSGNSYLRTRKKDGREVFDVSNERHLEYWISQPVDVYLVIRQSDEITGGQTIRWMNVTKYLKERKDKKSRQIIFEGEKLDMEAVYRVRDVFFPKSMKAM